MWLILQLFVTIGPKMWVKRSQVFLPESTWVGGQTQLVSIKMHTSYGNGRVRVGALRAKCANGGIFEAIWIKVMHPKYYSVEAQYE